jgi:Na+/H+ antiporter
LLEVLIALSLAILIGNIIAHKTRLTPAIVLIVLGLVLGLIPAHQLHEVQELGLPPHVILEIFLPIMLFWEARNTSWREIRKFMRGIILTGTLLVIFTAAVIAWTLNFFFGTDWGVALIIGAALAPTDATAVATLNGKLPKSSITILKAESLINDGTTLVIFALALQVANGHHLSLGPTTGMFFYSFAVGIFVGLAVGWTGNRIRAYLTNPMYFTVFMVTTPFIAFLISEQLEIAEGFKGSGVVAVVVAAIYLTYNGPDTITAQNRFYGLPIWAFISFVLNGALFVLVGVQLPEVWRAMDEVAQHNHYSAINGVMVVLVAWVTSVAARFVFLNVSVGIIRALDRSEKQRRLRSTLPRARGEHLRGPARGHLPGSGAIGARRRGGARIHYLCGGRGGYPFHGGAGSCAAGGDSVGKNPLRRFGDARNDRGCAPGLERELQESGRAGRAGECFPRGAGEHTRRM